LFERRPEDVQATLLEFTAQSVAAAIRQYAPGRILYVCGGGAQNRGLIDAIAPGSHPSPVASTATLGLDPDYVEAVAFAWFAREPWPVSLERRQRHRRPRRPHPRGCLSIRMKTQASVKD
jgi:1,6-anhydro-N-acetylmuramate kinase